MLTFLAALMCVFFDGTNLATLVSMGLVVGFLFVTVVLLLHLEGEGTFSGDGSVYMRLYTRSSEWLQSLWKRQDTEGSDDSRSKIGALWQWVCRILHRSRRDTEDSDSEKSSVTMA